MVTLATATVGIPQRRYWCRSLKPAVGSVVRATAVKLPQLYLVGYSRNVSAGSVSIMVVSIR